MFNALRELFSRSKPAAFALIAVAFVAVLMFVFRGGRSGNAYSLDNMTRKVNVEFADTGDKAEMRWGQIEREIILRPGMPSESEGLMNPKTGKLTGFPNDKRAWKEMIVRLQKTKAAYERSP